MHQVNLVFLTQIHTDCFPRVDIHPDGFFLVVLFLSSDFLLSRQIEFNNNALYIHFSLHSISSLWHVTIIISFQINSMIKTTNLTKTVYNTHPVHSQPIRLYTPSITSSSGSACETEPSSISSSYKSNTGTTDDLDHLLSDESTTSLIAIVEKLKRELATTKQAKSQLATLYKVNLFVFVR